MQVRRPGVAHGVIMPGPIRTDGTDRGRRGCASLLRTMRRREQTVHRYSRGRRSGLVRRPRPGTRFLPCPGPADPQRQRITLGIAGSVPESPVRAVHSSAPRPRPAPHHGCGRISSPCGGKASHLLGAAETGVSEVAHGISGTGSPPVAAARTYGAPIADRAP
jgi:hypothetical protein